MLCREVDMSNWRGDSATLGAVYLRWEVCSIPVRLLDIYVGVHSLNLLQAGLRWLWH